MRRLILLRHGKAEEPAGGGDLARALVPRGASDAALIGRVLAEAGFAPTLVLVSPARRTAETWEALAPSFPDAVAQTARDLHQADHRQALDLAQAAASGSPAPREAVIMLVGHNPAMHNLAAHLARRAESAGRMRSALTQGFPTASAAVFRFAPDGAATGEGLFTPKTHGGGAEAA